MTKKTRAELEAENRLLRTHSLGDNVSRVVHSLIKYGAYVLIAYYAIAQPIDSLSGKTTQADIKIDSATSLSVNRSDTTPVGSRSTNYCLIFGAVSLVFGFAGIAYGWKQAKLRKDVVERIQARNQTLEKKLDPKRSTSSLTPRGDTRPEDL